MRESAHPDSRLVCFPRSSQSGSLVQNACTLSSGAAVLANHVLLFGATADSERYLVSIYLINQACIAALLKFISF